MAARFSIACRKPGRSRQLSGYAKTGLQPFCAIGETCSTGSWEPRCSAIRHRLRRHAWAWQSLLAACGSDEEALLKYAKARKMPDEPGGSLHGLRQRDEAQQAGVCQPEGQPGDDIGAVGHLRLPEQDHDHGLRGGTLQGDLGVCHLHGAGDQEAPAALQQEGHEAEAEDHGRRQSGWKRPSTPASRPTRREQGARAPSCSSSCRPRNRRRRRTARPRQSSSTADAGIRPGVPPSSS